MNKISAFLILFLVLLLGSAVVGSSVGRAEEAVLAGRNFDESKEAEVAQRARKRLYPGGKDETDLKVQTQLSNPVRKMAPSMNVSADPEASSSED